LISEVSPVAKPTGEQVNFNPLDVLAAFLNAYPQAHPGRQAMLDIFGQQLRLSADLAEKAGLRLVVRDHSHSGYMSPFRDDRSSFLESCSGFDSIRSLVTVRYPFSSYMSLKRNGWDIHVRDYEDYCGRYMHFLDHHAAAEIVKYEHFCQEPEHSVREFCRILDLAYCETFAERWPVRKLTGNSGRGREMSEIRPLPFRDWTEERSEALSKLAIHAELCRRLGYHPDLAVYAAEANKLAGMPPSPSIDSSKKTRFVQRIRRYGRYVGWRRVDGRGQRL